MKCTVIGRGRWSDIILPYIRKEFDVVSVTGRNDTDIDELAKSVDAFFIITPIETHYTLAKACLFTGKHVFCEKPLSKTYRECIDLEKIAKKNKLVLFTDYTDMYSRTIELIKRKDLGELKHFFAHTEKKRKMSNDNIFWNLHCHQISILSELIDISKISFYEKNKVISFCNFKENNASGLISSQFNSEKNQKKISVHYEHGIICVDFEKNILTKENFLNNEKKTIAIDEKNNLSHSVKEFKDIIFKTKENNNLKKSILITKTIQEIIENEKNSRI